MHSKKLSRLVEDVLKEGRLQERTFWAIQKTLLSCPELEGDDIIEIAKGESLYNKLERIQDSHQIVLYSRGLVNSLKLGVMGARAREALGSGMRGLEFYEKAKQGNGEVRYLTESENRGFIYLVKVGHKDFVLKPLQSKDEVIVAPIAAQTPVAPKVEEIRGGWIVEEFIGGPDFFHANLNLREAGEKLGYVYGHLHPKTIYYGDRFMPHLFFPERGPVMIDYGVSTLGDHYMECDIRHALSYSKSPEFRRAF